MEPEGTRGSVIISDTSRRSLSTQEEALVLFVIEGIMTSLSKMHQYPITNEIVVEKVASTYYYISKWLRSFREFQCVSVQGNLQVNKAILSMSSQEKDFVQTFLFYLTERNIRTFSIQKGLKLKELKGFLEFFNKPAKEFVSNKNISRTLKRNGLKKIILSPELVLSDVIIKTKIGSELTRRLSKLNVDELVEKANVISQLDMQALNKVSNLATMVTNLRHMNNTEVSDNILKRLSITLHDENPRNRVASAMQFAQIAEKSVDYTMYDLHSEVGEKMSRQIAVEDDPQVFGALAKGLEKAAQVHIAKGEYDKAMKIIGSIERVDKTENKIPSKIVRHSELTIKNIANPQSIKKIILSLQSSDRKTQQAAAKVLREMGKNTTPYLIDMIYESEDEKIISLGVKLLKDIGQPVLQELYTELRENMASNFRIAFISIIGEVGGVRSLKHLMPFLVDQNDDVVEETYHAFLNIGGPGAEQKIIDNLRDLNFESDFFLRLVHDFGKFKNHGLIQPLVELINDKGAFAKYANAQTKEGVVDALGRVGGKEVVDGLSAYLLKKKGFLGLGKGDEKLEMAICKALRRIGDPAAKNGLNKALKSKNKEVKTAAELALNAFCEDDKKKDVAAVGMEGKAPDVVGHAINEQATFMHDQPDIQTTEMEFPNLDGSDNYKLATEEAPTTFGSKKGDMETKTKETLVSDESIVASEIKILLTVGQLIIDNVLVKINGLDQAEKTTANQEGVVFQLAPGEYEAIIHDQGMKIGKQFIVTGSETEVRLDLQDIFNF